jgi:hypothetical protein
VPLVFVMHVAVTAKKTKGYRAEKRNFEKTKLVMSSVPIRSSLDPISGLKTGCTPHARGVLIHEWLVASDHLNWTQQMAMILPVCEHIVIEPEKRKYLPLARC